MKTVAAVLALALAATALYAHDHAAPADRKAALEAVVATERAFAKLGEEKGVKDSFLAYIADDGLLFRPGPVRGKDFLSARPAPPIKLLWRPSHADVSAAGDLGWTMGPWQLYPPNAPADAPPATGYFVTLWKKQADGSYKWILDHGTPNPHPATREADFVVPDTGKGVKLATAIADLAAGREALFAVDRALAAGTADAYAARLADGARVLRMGEPLVIGKEAAGKALTVQKTANWKLDQGGLADSGDLGYTYGTVDMPGEGPQGETLTGDYLKIWQKDGAGEWKIVLDMVAPRLPPPPQPPPAQKPA